MQTALRAHRSFAEPAQDTAPYTREEEVTCSLAMHNPIMWDRHSCLPFPFSASSASLRFILCFCKYACRMFRHCQTIVRPQCPRATYSRLNPPNTPLPIFSATEKPFGTAFTIPSPYETFPK